MDYLFNLLFFLFSLFILYFLYKIKFKFTNNLSNLNDSNNNLITCNEFIEICSQNNFPTNYNKISILTYNILCQRFMKRIGKKELTLDNRMNIVIREIRSLNPDVICLQETNYNTYKKYFFTNFTDYSFEYGENYGSPFINVIGFKKNKFKLIKRKTINCCQIDVEGNRGIYNLHLQEINSKQTFSIFNVHFPWKPIYEIEKSYFLNLIAEDILSTRNYVDHFIIAGDFNSIPNSLVLRMIYTDEFFDEIKVLSQIENINKHFIEFIKEYELLKHINEIVVEDKLTFDLSNKYDNKHFSLINNIIKDILNNEKHRNKFSKVIRNFVVLKEDFNFKSSYGEYKKYIKTEHDNYSKLKFIKHHPDYTNFTENFKDTIDYIFHSHKLTLTKILKLPNKSEVLHERFLPSSRFPSDHIKLYSEFIYL